MAGNTPRHRRVWKNALHTEGSKPSLCISNPIVRLPECGCPHCSACKDTEISASLNEETSICLSATSPPSLRIPSKASKKHRHRLSDMKKSPRTAQWLPAGINHLFKSGKRDSNFRFVIAMYQYVVAILSVFGSLIHSDRAIRLCFSMQIQR